MSELKSEALLGALFLCKNQIPEIEKKKTAKIKTKSGAEYSYKYADLADVQRAIKKPLEDHGLVLRHEISNAEDGEVLTTFLTHVATKEFYTSAIEIKSAEMQEKGADITYAKRYNIGCLLDLLLDEDIDGTPKQEQPQQTQNKPAATSGNPGDYLIRVGKKYFGKKLNEVPYVALRSYAAWLEDESIAKKKPLGSYAKEFIDALSKIAPPDDGNGPPPFDQDEELPF